MVFPKRKIGAVRSKLPTSLAVEDNRRERFTVGRLFFVFSFFILFFLVRKFSGAGIYDGAGGGVRIEVEKPLQARGGIGLHFPILALRAVA